MEHNLYGKISAEASIDPDAYSTTQTGTYVDLKGYEGCLFMVACGEVTSDVEVTVEYQECATTDGTFTAIAAADLVSDEKEPVLATDNDDQAFLTDYIGNKRYVKAVATYSGATNADMGIYVLRYRARHGEAGDTQAP